MVQFKFIRRKCDIERYERAMRLLDQVTDTFAKKELKKVINEYKTKTKIISFFVNNPNVEVVISNANKEGKVYKLPIKIIAKTDEKGYFVKDGMMSCQLIGENYTDTRLNVGADYHSISVVTSCGQISYWHQSNNEFLLYQLENQDKLEDMCKDYNLLAKNWFEV